MFSSTTKNMLKNIIRHTNVHNRVKEEAECWNQLNKQKDQGHEGSSSPSPSPSPSRRSFLYDARAEPSRAEDRGRKSQQAHMDDGDSSKQSSTFYTRQLAKAEEQDPDRWGHSGFKELYPDQFDSDRSNASDSDNSHLHWRKKMKKKGKKKLKKESKRKDSKGKSHKSKRESDSLSGDKAHSTSSSEDRKKKKKKKKKRKSDKDKSDKHKSDKHKKDRDQSDGFGDEYQSKMDRREDHQRDRNTERYRHEKDRASEQWAERNSDGHHRENYRSSNRPAHRDFPSSVVEERGRVSNGRPRISHEEWRKNRETRDRPMSKDRRRRTHDWTSQRHNDGNSRATLGKRKRGWNSDDSSSSDSDGNWKRSKV